MNSDKLIEILNDCCNDITFSFRGKKCGVFPEVENYKKKYHVLFRENVREFSSVDEMMKDPFFDGLCLLDICDEAEITIE